MNTLRLTAAALVAAGALLLAAPATADEAADRITRALTSTIAVDIDAIVQSPIPGFYEVRGRHQRTGGRVVLYASGDGEYFFHGDLFQMRDESLVNVTDIGRNRERRQLISGVSEDDMVVFPAVGTEKTHITVFTDVDCGFCRKLHQEVPEMNARGISVRYLAYPRAGAGSESYNRIVSAWCADEPQDALTRLKAGASIAPKVCSNPVVQQLALGREVGITGTPAIVLADGTLHPGYVTADQLQDMLGM